MSRARAHPNHPVPAIMHQRRDPPALIAGEELHPARGGGFVHGEQGIGCVCVPGAAVEVAFPVAEGAVVLPGDVADVVAGGHILNLVLVEGVVADGGHEAGERSDCFLGSGAGDEVEEAGLVVVGGVEGGFPGFDGVL